MGRSPTPRVPATSFQQDSLRPMLVARRLATKTSRCPVVSARAQIASARPNGRSCRDRAGAAVGQGERPGATSSGSRTSRSTATLRFTVGTDRLERDESSTSAPRLDAGPRPSDRGGTATADARRWWVGPSSGRRASLAAARSGRCDTCHHERPRRSIQAPKRGGELFRTRRGLERPPMQRSP